MLYLLLTIWLMICSFTRNSSIFIYNILLLFIFFSSAYCFNYDWMNYRVFYENLNSLSLIDNIVNSGFEPAFVAISMLCNTLKLDYQWVIILCDIIIFFCVVKTIGKFRNKNIALFVFFAFFGFYLIAEQIRQAVAISIGLLAFAKLKQGYSKSFFLYVVLAMLFHVSAVMIFSFYFLEKIFYMRKRRLLLIVFLIVGTILPSLFSILIQHPEWFSFYPLLMKKLSYYADSELGNNSAIITPGLLPNTLLLLICMVFFVRDIYYKYSQQAIVSAAFIIQSKVVALFYRFSNYGIIYIIYAVEDYLGSSRKNSVFIYISFVLCITLFALKPFSTELYRSSVMDYHFYWLSEKNDEAKIKISRCDVLYNVYPDSPYTIGTCK